MKTFACNVMIVLLSLHASWSREPELAISAPPTDIQRSWIGTWAGTKQALELSK